MASCGTSIEASRPSLDSRAASVSATRREEATLAVDRRAIGKSYPPFEYEVGREKIREYAHAVGEDNLVYFDRAAARAAGFRDVVAPPMFAAVYSAGAVWPAWFDPEVGVDFGMMVHGAQEFTWHGPVVAGDEITTEAALAETAERGGMRFFTFTTRSTNQRGELVCEGRWTNIVR